ncbi:hypothetical protein P280DRAFT_438813 [Massarina eburnea CBS 473.64]|uniref:DUF1365-domain-containing protein n=1 Tax=Massarina eburnea CBS 473.64 TaxID=1395130 RepID=A0A6A6RHF5_9PLEO|nr:hypothetical protein P280DRAFT_438813 [Massarina eburnea CBS 473.64]
MGTQTSSRIGSIRSFLPIFLSVIPCALVLRWYTWPFLLLWAVPGGLRLRRGDRKVSTDCLLFGLINIWILKGGLMEVIWKRWDALEEMLGMKRSLLTPVLVSLVPLAVSGFLILNRRGSEDEEVSEVKLPQVSRPWTLEHPGSLIFPCQTTHARVFPKKHAFDYSYLLCGFPIVPAGVAADGNNVGDGKDRSMGSWWLRIRAEDYLERGMGGLGFYGKLQTFLREHNVEDNEWSYAYLVTAPRFFGYSFNPVSFWYIYDRNHELKKMILEVNNTFGEKRLYLLDGSSPLSRAQTSGSEPPIRSSPSKTKFTDIWMKDFHVSPFNSRKGSYSLKAFNPFPFSTFEDPKIDNTIILRSSKDHAKIVARVFTTGNPIKATDMGVIGTLRFIQSWWWVGFVTSPRIIKEAFKLYHTRNLHVWLRPEVMVSSVGREPTSTEEDVQKIFADYLNHLVQQSPVAFEISYHTAIPARPKYVITKRGHDHDKNIKKLALQISTPVFYSRFVHYAHTSEALDRECLFTDEKNRTVWISNPELLPQLLPKLGTKLRSESKEFVERTYFDELRWKVLRKLRCPPVEPTYPVTPKAPEFDVNDIRTLPYSDLDSFVRGPEGLAYAGFYRRMVTEMFLARRVFMGFSQTMEDADFVVRALVCWTASQRLSWWARSVEPQAGQPVGGTYLKITGTEWWWVSSLALWVCGCHVYGLLKGYR